MTDTKETMARGTWRMPVEWEPHEGCLMAWPTRAELWGSHGAEARREYAETADAIAAFEPVTMVALPGRAAEVREACGAAVEVVEIPIDDSWMRDSGPIFIVDDEGNRRGVDFVFNSWGERFAPFDRDAALAAAILETLGIPRLASPMVLEGGAITVDGEGTLITTEQCLLAPNRNPGMSRRQMEEELRRTLGVMKVICLPWGGYEDDHTDGHVDGVCTYVRPGVVIAQTCDEEANPNFALMAENLAILNDACDAGGRPIKVIELPYLPYFDLDGQRLVTSYPNFYVANGGVSPAGSSRPAAAGLTASRSRSRPASGAGDADGPLRSGRPLRTVQRAEPRAPWSPSRPRSPR